MKTFLEAHEIPADAKRKWWRLSRLRRTRALVYHLSS